MATSSLKDRIRSEYQQLLDNFANLLRSSRLADEAGDAGSRQVRVRPALGPLLQRCEAPYFPNMSLKV
jgi:hypothetical protein